MPPVRILHLPIRVGVPPWRSHGVPDPNRRATGGGAVDPRLFIRGRRPNWSFIPDILLTHRMRSGCGRTRMRPHEHHHRLAAARALATHAAVQFAGGTGAAWSLAG